MYVLNKDTCQNIKMGWCFFVCFIIINITFDHLVLQYEMIL